MCMSKVEFGLMWNEKEKDFIGIGYKRLPFIIQDKAGRINLSKVPEKYKGIFSTKWQEATGRRNNFGKELDRLIKASDLKQYWPGFHIFLNETDVIKYGRFNSLVKVAFKGVTSFGANTTDYKSEHGPCVVARYMKIVELL